ncbi:MAG: hypothetical protein AAF430_05525 [Myxococcota bacterium]
MTITFPILFLAWFVFVSFGIGVLVAGERSWSRVRARRTVRSVPALTPARA